MFWYRGITIYVNVNDTQIQRRKKWVKPMFKKKFMYVYVKIAYEFWAFVPACFSYRFCLNLE